MAPEIVEIDISELQEPVIEEVDIAELGFEAPVDEPEFEQPVIEEVDVSELADVQLPETRIEGQPDFNVGVLGIEGLMGDEDFGVDVKKGVVDVFRQARERGKLNVEIAQVRADIGATLEGNNLAAKLKAVRKERPTNLSFIQKHLVNFAGEQSAMMGAAIERGAKTALLGASVGAAAGMGGAVIGAVPGAVVGAGLGFAGGAYLAVYDIEGGLAYDEFLDAGVDPSIARKVAGVVGAANAALEFLSLGVLGKTLGRPITDAVKLAVKTGIRTGLIKSAKKPLLMSRLTPVLMDWGTAVATETSTEVLQEFSTILGDSIAKELTTGKTGKQFASLYNSKAEWHSAAKRLADTAVEVGFGIGLTGGVAVGPRLVAATGGVTTKPAATPSGGFGTLPSGYSKQVVGKIRNAESKILRIQELRSDAESTSPDINSKHAKQRLAAEMANYGKTPDEKIGNLYREIAELQGVDVEAADKATAAKAAAKAAASKPAAPVTIEGVNTTEDAITGLYHAEALMAENELALVTVTDNVHANKGDALLDIVKESGGFRLSSVRGVDDGWLQLRESSLGRALQGYMRGKNKNVSMTDSWVEENADRLRPMGIETADDFWEALNEVAPNWTSRDSRKQSITAINTEGGRLIKEHGDLLTWLRENEPDLFTAEYDMTASNIDATWQRSNLPQDEVVDETIIDMSETEAYAKNLANEIWVEIFGKSTPDPRTADYELKAYQRSNGEIYPMRSAEILEERIAKLAVDETEVVDEATVEDDSFDYGANVEEVDVVDAITAGDLSIVGAIERYGDIQNIKDVVEEQIVYEYDDYYWDHIPADVKGVIEKHYPKMYEEWSQRKYTGAEDAMPDLMLEGERINVVKKKAEQAGLGMDLGQAQMPESGLTGTEVTETEMEARLAEIEAERQQPSLLDVEKKLAEDVDTTVGKAPPPGGLAIQKVGGTKGRPLYTAEDIKFKDPEVEAAHQANHGLGVPSAWEKFKEFAARFGRRSTRVFEHLPNIPKYAELKLFLLRLSKAKSIASDRTVRKIQGLTIAMTKVQYGLYERVVLLNDLMNEVLAGRKLPNKFTPEMVKAELQRATHNVKRDKLVRDAISKRRSLWDGLRAEYAANMDAIGVAAAENFTNPDYFRHQVLLHAVGKTVKGVRKVKSPTGRSFQQQRQGGEFGINTNYVEAEFEVMAQMLHDIDVAKFIQYVDTKFNIVPSLKAAAKANGLTAHEWKTQIPEGYRAWQPREGNYFYMADSIPSKVATMLVEGHLESFNLTAEQIKKVMAVGGKRTEFVLPVELADTLDKPFVERSESGYMNVDRKALKAWKAWSLVSPRRFFKYNIRNITGDMEATFIGNPKVFKKSVRAARELYQVFKNDGAMTDNLRDWFLRGGWETTLQAQEMGELNKLSPLKHLTSEKLKAQDMPASTWKKYWHTVRLATDFRESILRYAAYLQFLEELEAGNGKPTTYGASIPADVNAITNNKDKAFKLANDLLGAYDEVTVTGNAIRDHLMPFYSFQEINLKRYMRFMRNIWDDEATTGMVGRMMVGATGKTAVKLGSFAIKASVLWAATQVWNNTMFPDEEEDLPEEVRSRPHINFGRNAQGQAMYFSRIGIAGDFLEWFGLDAFPTLVDRWLNGQMTIGDIGKEIGKSPVNKVVNGSLPFVKLLFEMAGRRTYFPDVFNPRTIRDRGYHMARSFGLGNEYVALMKMPSKGYMDTMAEFLLYRVDPGKGPYAATIDLKNRLLKKLGKGAEGFHISPKGNAVYNLKLAIRYNDEEAKDKYLREYVRMVSQTRRPTSKMVAQSIDRSIKAMHPLHGLRANKLKGEKFSEVEVFKSTLNEEQRTDLMKAIIFYETILKGQPAIAGINYKE